MPTDPAARPVEPVGERLRKLTDVYESIVATEVVFDDGETDEVWTIPPSSITLLRELLVAEPDPAAPTPAPQGPDLADRDRLAEAARTVVETWTREWDCSRAPGHPGMDAAVNALDDAFGIKQPAATPQAPTEGTDNA